MTLMKEGKNREALLAFCMLIALTGLIILHLAVSWELNYANEQINSQHKAIELCWKLKLNQTPRTVDSQSKELKLIETRIKHLQPRLDPILRQKIASAILENSKKYKLSPSLIIHLIYQETKFNPLARSNKDALGLMQVMYKVHKKDNPELAKIKPEKFYHVNVNINFGCQILRKYIDSKKTLDKALEKYVGGEVKGYVADIFRLMAEWEQGKYK